jgi:hypothetical protein
MRERYLVSAPDGAAIIAGHWVLTGDAATQRVARVERIIIAATTPLQITLRLTWFEADGSEIEGLARLCCVLAAAPTRPEIEAIAANLRDMDGEVTQ